MSETRKLAAILCSDVVGYSRLAGVDEDRILARLRALRSDLIDPTISVHNGRVVKRTGDGALIEFRSIVDAVRCAIEVQNAMVERNSGVPEGQRIVFRIGIHLGDVVEESDGDLMGDGVNIAARLEGIAEPGGICLSEDAYRQVRDRLKEAFVDLGEKALKNIARPVRAFGVALDRSAPKIESGAPENPTWLALPNRPSIAILPFQNISGDPEQEYFADGMVEDITTALSRIGGLFVIARNSSFAYKGKSPDVPRVGRELGVRYVLEGSVRKAGARVRIVCQLINASTGAHVWADRFDSTLDDIFDLQDRVTESVAGAIEPTLRNAEIVRAANKPTESLDAFDLYLRGLHHHDRFTRADFEEALRLLRRAVSLDPNFAPAKALAASCVMQMVELGAYPMGGAEKSQAVDLARSALAVARDNPTTLSYAGNAIACMGLDMEAGRMALDRAMLLNPNSAHALGVSGWIHNFTGDWSVARDEFDRAMRLSPLDPDLRFLLLGLGIAMYEMGEAGPAVNIIRRSIAAGMSRVWFAWSHLINCLVLLGRMDEAREAARALSELDPRRTLAGARAQMAEWNSPHRERRLASLRASGIPEG